MCGDCVAAWIVRCSEPWSYDAMSPRHSIGTGWWRWTQMLASMIRSALAKAPLTSPKSRSLVYATLSSNSSNSGGFAGSNASS